MTLQLPADVPPCRAPICGVVAIALAANIPFAQAWELTKLRMKSPNRWRGRTTLKQRVRVLDVLDVPYQEVKLPRQMTLKTFVENHTRRDVTYKVTVTGHVVTVRNKAVADQGGVFNILLHRSRRQQVRNALEIEGVA